MRQPVVWRPHSPPPGVFYSAQELFLSCPYDEALLEGGRGGGKTAALLVDFAQDTGKGWGAAWRGILFRETYPQLEDVKAKSLDLFKKAFPDAVFNSTNYVWTWPDGEKLFLRHIRTEDDYWNYHGHEYPWIGWEELTNWRNLKCYEMMRACCRTSHPEVGKVKRIRATTNPWGKGHGAVKKYFVDPAPEGVVIRDVSGRTRVRIYAPLEQNKPFLDADPDYKSRILDSVQDPNVKKAWGGGPDRWDVATGAFFSDCITAQHNVLEPFEIPATWPIDRSFDWGSSKPFSVGWYARSDGSEVEIAPGVKRTFARGSIFRVAEWYGWNGSEDQGLRMTATAIAAKIKDMDKLMKRPVHPGPADTSIWDTVNGHCIADDFAAAGIRWERADKSPGSRVVGWQRCRSYCLAAHKTPMEAPGFFVFSTCRQFLRTVPSLVHDPRNPDDLDSEGEDHIADEWRYRLLAVHHGGTVTQRDVNQLPGIRGRR